MRQLLRAAAIAAVLAGGLAACGDDDDDTPVVVTPPPPPVTPPTPPSRLEDQFGANFGAAFRAVANSDPRDPQPGDVIGVSFTTDPVPIP